MLPTTLGETILENLGKTPVYVDYDLLLKKINHFAKNSGTNEIIDFNNGLTLVLLAILGNKPLYQTVSVGISGRITYKSFLSVTNNIYFRNTIRFNNHFYRINKPGKKMVEFDITACHPVILIIIRGDTKGLTKIYAQNLDPYSVFSDGTADIDRKELKFAFLLIGNGAGDAKLIKKGIPKERIPFLRNC